MTASAFRIRWLTVLTVLAVTAVLSACNGNPAPTSVPRDTPAATATPTPVPTPATAPTPVPTATVTPGPTPIPTATATPVPTPIPTATATPAPTPIPTTAPTPIPASPTPEPSGAVANLDINVDNDTVWQELFDGFTASEQSCIRDALGGELLQSTLKQPVLIDRDWDAAQVFSCLGPQVAESVFLFILVAGMEEQVGTKLSEDEKACFRELFTDTDVPALITASDDSAAFAEFWITRLSCAPAQLLSSAFGADVELSEDEASCLRESIAEIDAAVLMAADDSTASAVLGMSLLSCAPAQLLSSAFGADVELSEDEASCLRESSTDIDAAALVAAGDSAASAEIGVALLSCVPAQFLSIAFGVDVELSEGEASCLRESFTDSGFAALMAADGSAASAEIGMAILSCVPGLVLSSAIGEDVELTEDEAACLRESITEIDAAALMADDADPALDEPALSVEFAAGLLNCVPHLFVSFLAGGELGEDEESCLRDLVANTDAAALVAADEHSAAYARFGAGLLVCVPDLFITGGEGDAGAASDEDHANSSREAIAVTVGRSA